MTEKSTKKLKITLMITAYVISIAVTLVATFFITKDNCQTQPNKSAYQIAMEDSMVIDDNEILPLVTITEQSDMVTWNQSGDKVLMISWNRYPDSYENGSTFECVYGEIWSFTDREIMNWFQNNYTGSVFSSLRFEQLIGLPKDNGYTHFTAFWVDDEELIRPAYQTDITKQVSANDLDGSALGEYQDWFNGNIAWSYVNSAYPWTRLGYTYDWTNDGKDYGLTEFIILPNSTIEVAWTVTNQEFFEMLQNGSFS